MNHLLGVWLSGNKEESKAVRKKLDEKIDSYAAGELEHAVDAISSIWEISISNKEGPAPAGAPPLRDPLSWLAFFSTRSTGDDMRHPLIKSIQEGYLLDQKYWARRSREGAIEPVYFSSAIAENELSRLGGCESPCLRAA